MNGYTDTKDHTIIRQKTHDLHMIHPFDVKNHSFIYRFGIGFKQGSNRNHSFYMLHPFLIFDLEFWQFYRKYILVGVWLLFNAKWAILFIIEMYSSYIYVL